MGNNIVLPYSGHIPGGIRDGTDVVINGRTHPHFKRFSINLCIGPTCDHDCALHFNPRFDQNQVVRNHKQGGSWGGEETAGHMPFRRGHNFEIHMKVHPHGYKITINQRHFCDFHHRLPKESVQYIYIDGDVTINFIQFQGGSHFPKPSLPPAPSYPTGPSFPPAPSFPSYPPAPSYPGGGPIYNPPVPFTTAIPGGIYPGKIISISGTPHPSPSRFTINLVCGAYDSCDFALHFDARFNFGSDRNQVIRTHKQGGSYGSEERHINFFPFYPNTPFEIMILTEPGSFKIAVNNQHFTEFFHRIQPINRISNLMVVGDLRLSQVRFQ